MESSCSTNIRCRICRGSDIQDMISPCKCRGSIQYVHSNCLNSWMRSVPRHSCEICNYPLKQTYQYLWLFQLHRFKYYCVNNYFLKCLFEALYMVIGFLSVFVAGQVLESLVFNNGQTESLFIVQQTLKSILENLYLIHAIVCDLLNDLWSIKYF